MRTFTIIFGIFIISIGAGALWDAGGFFLALGAACILTGAFYTIVYRKAKT